MTATPGQDGAGTEPTRTFGSSLPRSWLVIAAALPIVLILALGVFLAISSGPSGGTIGARAPSFELRDTDGALVRLSDFQGRPVIVNFWGSGCPPCVEEFPLLLRAESDHAAEGLAVIGIVFRDSQTAARDFMERMGADWPALMDPEERVARQYEIFGVPETFFIDRSGTIIARQIGQLRHSDLERHLAKILNQGANG